MLRVLRALGNNNNKHALGGLEGGVISRSLILIREKCRKFSSAILSYCIIFFTIACTTTGPAMSQSVPDDFAVELSSNVNQPGYPYPAEMVSISPSGAVQYSQMEREDGMLPEATSEISGDARASIYTAIMENDFFNLDAQYRSPAIIDGDYAQLTITANGVTHSVRTVNMRVNDFDDIVKAVNRQLPKERWIIYNALYVDEYDEVDR